MSFADFDRGIPAEEVRKRNRFITAEDMAKERLRKWSESEHVLNMLRSIKASQEAWNEEEMKTWLRITGKKKP